MSDTRVYFIGSARSNAVKIGVSENPRSRLSAMQTGSAQRLVLLAEMPGDERYERTLHRAFSEYRIRGEWFRNEGRLADFISVLPIMEMLAPPPKRRQDKPIRDPEELARQRADDDEFWAGYLPLIREEVLRIGTRQFAEHVGARVSDVVRSLYPNRGRSFRVKWFMHLGAVLPQERARALFEPFMNHLGFTIVTPEEAAQIEAEEARYQLMRAETVARFGDLGRKLIADFDVEIAEEVGRRKAVGGTP